MFKGFSVLSLWRLLAPGAWPFCSKPMETIDTRGVAKFDPWDINGII